MEHVSYFARACDPPAFDAYTLVAKVSVVVVLVVHLDAPYHVVNKVWCDESIEQRTPNWGLNI
jgi:hypothetical protein